MKKTIKNPWHEKGNKYSNPFYSLDEPLGCYESYDFYNQCGSIIAVKDGVVLTECCTIAGALRVLKEKENEKPI